MTEEEVEIALGIKFRCVKCKIIKPISRLQRSFECGDRKTGKDRVYTLSRTLCCRCVCSMISDVASTATVAQIKMFNEYFPDFND